MVLVSLDVVLDIVLLPLVLNNFTRANDVDIEDVVRRLEDMEQRGMTVVFKLFKLSLMFLSMRLILYIHYCFIL